MITCAACGAPADEPPATWAWQTGPGGRQQWLCDDCTREVLRNIEARLDVEIAG